MKTLIKICCMMLSHLLVDDKKKREKVKENIQMIDCT